jgi:steroid delta-isomerase-like uncharacterized protein
VQQTRKKEEAMREKALVLVTLLVLVSVGSSARGADTQALEQTLDQWAPAWSSNDAEKLLPLFADNVDYEDVTLGAVNHGKNALRDFATGAFAAFADLKFELKSRFVAADGKSGALEWTWRAGKRKTFPACQRPTSPSRFVVRQSLSLLMERSVAIRTIGIWRPT